jgi:Tfp pilus assembly protein FimT
MWEGPPACTRKAWPTAPCRVVRHHALTLLEILLVLALIVIVFAVAVPTLTGSLSHQRLKKSGEVVRAAFSRARVEAMRTGQIQAFHSQAWGNKYDVVSWSMAEDAIEADVPAAADVPATSAGGWGLMNAQTAETLPDGIVFVGQTEIVDERTETIAAEAVDTAATASRYDTPWSPPILFYPDGTTSDARVVLRNERGWIVAVELRGLTGVASVGRPEREPEQFRDRR